MGRGIREALGVAEATAEAPVMPSEIDIYRSAKLLIGQHGEDAAIFVAMQADRCLAADNLDGKATWMRIIGAIKELLNQDPKGEGTTIH